jgi:hypothetical protein
MNADTFAEWLRQQHYRVVRTASSYWYEAGAHVFQAFPYHWTIDPSAEELAELFWRERAIALRYSTGVTAPFGKISYHVVRTGSYDLESLPRQARQNISRGLQYAQVQRISLDRLGTDGWMARLDTLRRQGRESAETRTWWQRLCECAQGLPGFEAWGALHDGELVASCLVFWCDNCCTIPHEQSLSSHLSQRPNNALFFVVVHEALQRGAGQVFLCVESLDAPESVNEFKFRMGFQAKPVRQCVAFHPLLMSWLTPHMHKLVQRLVARYPGKPALAKAEGMLRFCLEGARPAADQNWPGELRDQRDALLPVLAAGFGR